MAPADHSDERAFSSVSILDRFSRYALDDQLPTSSIASQLLSAIVRCQLVAIDGQSKC